MKEKEGGKESTGKKGAGRERGNSQFSGTISLKIQLLVVVIGEQFRGETPGREGVRARATEEAAAAAEEGRAK